VCAAGLCGKVSSMRLRVWIGVLVCVIAGVPGYAQAGPTQQELETRLKSQTLILRGMWDGSKLAFDSQGNLVGRARVLPFSLSAVIVGNVRLSDSKLEIKGVRAGLMFAQSIGARPYQGSGKIDVVIARDGQHPEELEPALQKVFSMGIDGALAANAPQYWREYLSRRLNPPEAGTPADCGGFDADPLQPKSALSDHSGPDENGIYHSAKGNGVTPPRLVRAPDPPFTEAARALKYQGVVIVGLVVDTSGRPQAVHITRPLGMGLDENAVASVSQYQFKPAIYQGKPVPVQICIEVGYAIN